MWHRISTCTRGAIDSKAISHAGLRTDGQFALVFSRVGRGVVWDLGESRIRRFLPDDMPILDQFVSREGFLHVNYGVGHGKYRVFGELHNYPLSEHPDLNLGIAVDAILKTATLYTLGTDQPVCTLPCESMTGEWAVGSFSDDGRMAAIVERSAVTFYAPDQEQQNPAERRN